MSKDNDSGKSTQEIFDFDGTLVVRDETKKCWALSPRDYMGVITDDKLKFVGNFELVY